VHVPAGIITGKKQRISRITCSRWRTLKFTNDLIKKKLTFCGPVETFISHCLTFDVVQKLPKFHIIFRIYTYPKNFLLLITIEKLDKLVFFVCSLRKKYSRDTEAHNNFCFLVEPLFRYLLNSTACI
jgi:hypothetical protein